MPMKRMKRIQFLVKSTTPQSDMVAKVSARTRPQLFGPIQSHVFSFLPAPVNEFKQKTCGA